MAICTEEFLRKINDFAVLMTMGMNTHEGLSVLRLKYVIFYYTVNPHIFLYYLNN